MEAHRNIWLAIMAVLEGAAITLFIYALTTSDHGRPDWTRPVMLGAVVLGVLGVLALWCAVRHVKVPGLRERVAPQPTSFPDLEIEVTKQGRTIGSTIIHGMSPIATPILSYGFRIVNHEPVRRALLTIRLFADFDPLDDGGPPEVFCAPFSGMDLGGMTPVATLPSPLNLGPGEGASGDLAYERMDWGGRSQGLPVRIEFEDHLSSAKVSMEPHFGPWRVRDEQ
jgi:hypothetical protein